VICDVLELQLSKIKITKWTRMSSTRTEVVEFQKKKDDYSLPTHKLLE